MNFSKKGKKFDFFWIIFQILRSIRYGNCKVRLLRTKTAIITSLILLQLFFERFIRELFLQGLNDFKSFFATENAWTLYLECLFYFLIEIFLHDSFEKVVFGSTIL